MDFKVSIRERSYLSDWTREVAPDQRNVVILATSGGNRALPEPF
jgi:hypothetical protein